MRNGQKVLSLTTFHYSFRQKNVTGLSNGFSSVFCKKFMFSACLLCEIQYIEKSWLDIDFNKICYRAVIEFLTLRNVQPQHIHSWMTVVYGENAPSHAMVSDGQSSFVKA